MENQDYNLQESQKAAGSDAEKPRKREYCEGSQFKFEDLYVTPFTKKRVYDPDGNISYIPIERNYHPTGIDVIDEFLVGLSTGHWATYEKYGYKSQTIYSFIYLLTGIGGMEFVTKWRVRVASDLLQYTNLSMPEIARRSSLHSAGNLNYFIQKEFDCSPLLHRYYLREEGDLGRFKL